MRTRYAIESLALAVTGALVLAACDAPKIKYGAKSFGLEDDTALDADGSDGDIVLAGDAGDPSSGDAHPIVTDGSDQGGDEGTAAADAGADGVPDDDVEKLPPDALIKDNLYRARFDLDSTRGIRDSSGYRDLSDLVEGGIREKLTTKTTDGLGVTQTFGDGEARSLTSQRVTNSAGDANREAGTSSASGLRALDRIVSSDCPGVFVCVERMVMKPDEGAPVTVCFADSESGERKPFPFGAAPNYKEADFDAVYGVYGPYDVTTYAGAAIDCDAPEKGPLVEETITVTVSKGSLAGKASAFSLRTLKPVTPTYAVDFVLSRTEDDLIAPYIDETLLLNHRTSYLIDEATSEIAKLVVTTRMSIDIFLVNLDGITVDLHFELCQNRLDAKDAGQCP